MKPKCERKKTTTLLKGLLFSFLVLTGLSEVSAQHQTLDPHFLEHYGGVELLISNGNDLQEVLSWPGTTPDHGFSREHPVVYVNAEAYNKILEGKIEHKIVQHPKSVIKMMDKEQIDILKSGSLCMPVMDFYPTYEAYEEMMYEFESQYPELCKIHEIGTLNSGRKILVAQIGDNLDRTEDEPNFLYNSTMHGNEPAGYPLMLQLIDLLLCNYGTDERLTNMVDNINIYINPLDNPNGAYRTGNWTIEGAIRYNSSFTDLNRNFPDPEDGDNPDGRNHQEETLIFMQFAHDFNINLSCNIHGGVELANYPWDTFIQLPADVSWWEEVCRNYADTVQHHSPPGYFTHRNNGITNGFEWYEVQGGRQDYMIYFHRAREFTLELSNQKLLDSDRIPEVWNANKNALLNYMEESLYGLRGQITHCFTGEPLEAEIYIPGHDVDNSSVFSLPENGSYFRYLDNGSYPV